MTMLLLCLACIATVLINGQLYRSMEQMQKQRVDSRKPSAGRRSRRRS